MTAFAPSIMQAFTFNNPAKCIFLDDLDAINVLYPTKEALLFPVCNTAKTYLGVMRLGVYVGMPLIVSLLLMLLTNRLLTLMHHASHRAGIARLQEAVKDPNVELKGADGQVLSQIEKRVVLIEAHIHTLTDARRLALKKGSKSTSPDVLALDEQIRNCVERVEKLRAGEDVEEEEKEDKDLLKNLLVPVWQLGKVTLSTLGAARVARMAAKYVPGSIGSLFGSSKEGLQIAPAPAGAPGAEPATAPSIPSLFDEAPPGADAAAGISTPKKDEAAEDKAASEAKK